MAKKRVYSRYAQEAARLLGEQIRLGRKQRQWSEKNLAERAGIARATLQKIENGEMTPAVGLVLEVAFLVGVTLFESDNIPLTKQIEYTQDKVALLPKRIKATERVIRDDF